MRWRQQKNESRGYRCSPFLGLLTGMLSVLWILGLIGLIAKSAILGYAIPAGIPLWIALLVWLCLYSFIIWPFKAARWHRYCSQNNQAPHCHHHGGFPGFIVCIAFWAIVIWALWHFVPDSHPYFDKVTLWGQHMLEKIKR